MVEPGGGGPGDRPGLPHRPDKAGPGAQVPVRLKAGGEDRRDDRGQEGGRGVGGRHWRGVADRTEHGATAGSGRPARGRGGLTGREGRRAAMPRYYEDFYHYEPSRPREVRGGIKAQSRRGSFAESWWGRPWLEVLE